MHARRWRSGAVAALAGTSLAAPAHAQVAPDPPAITPPAAQSAPVAPARSRAIGAPWHGRLLGGVQLPVAGEGFLSYDAIRRTFPDRPGRRWATDELLAMLERVAREFAAAHPGAAPLLIADLSRRHGGDFGRAYGGLGHSSHQNGLDADVMYPRRDGTPLAPLRPREVDRWLAQELVDRFVGAGAVRVFVGPRVALRGPRKLVIRLAHHDDHLHVRIHNPGR